MAELNDTVNSFYGVGGSIQNFSYKQAKLHSELISTGTEIVGTIERISLQGIRCRKNHHS